MKTLWGRRFKTFGVKACGDLEGIEEWSEIMKELQTIEFHWVSYKTRSISKLQTTRNFREDQQTAQTLHLLVNI
jgi:hypothetical protein